MYICEFIYYSAYVTFTWWDLSKAWNYCCLDILKSLQKQLPEYLARLYDNCTTVNFVRSIAIFLSLSLTELVA